MKIKKYTHEYPIEDMACFKLYCDYKNLKVGEVMRKILNNFLVDKAPEINVLMENQKKIVLSRKKLNGN